MIGVETVAVVVKRVIKEGGIGKIGTISGGSMITGELHNEAGILGHFSVACSRSAAKDRLMRCDSAR